MNKNELIIMKKQIFVMGDIHGRWEPIRDFYK